MLTECVNRAYGSTKTPTKGPEMTDTMEAYKARESWLANAVVQLLPKFEAIGFPVPAFRIAVGFSPVNTTKWIGVTLHTSLTADRINEVWIAPVKADAAQMLGIVVHEMCHVVDNCQGDGKGNGHAGRFAEAAVRIGLEGKMHQTVPGADLLMELELIAASLGEYPGSTVDMAKLKTKILVNPDGTEVKLSSGPKTQTTRMHKVVCPAEHVDTDLDGYTIRMSQKWIDLGLPMCPEGHQMLSE